MLRIAKVVQMAKRGMLGVCDILLFASANSSSEDGFDSEEGEGGSRALLICRQCRHGMVAVPSGFGDGKGLRQYPSTRKRIPAVMRIERIENKSQRAQEVFPS